MYFNIISRYVAYLEKIYEEYISPTMTVQSVNQPYFGLKGKRLTFWITVSIH